MTRTEILKMYNNALEGITLQYLMYEKNVFDYVTVTRYMDDICTDFMNVLGGLFSLSMISHNTYNYGMELEKNLREYKYDKITIMNK